ncbi:MAG: hypothetical protein AAF957_17225 [Planctomycetota bacterium]
MKPSLRPFESPDRRRAGWTTFAPLPAVLAALVVVPLLRLVPAVGGSPWMDVDVVDAVQNGAHSAWSFANRIFDAVTDPETLVRGVTGRGTGSTGVD